MLNIELICKIKNFKIIGFVNKCIICTWMYRIVYIIHFCIELNRKGYNKNNLQICIEGFIETKI